MSLCLSASPPPPFFLANMSNEGVLEEAKTAKQLLTYIRQTSVNIFWQEKRKHEIPYSTM